MKLQTAQSLLRENYRTMSLEQLQRFRVRLIDAIYECDGRTFGMARAVKNGFMKILESDSASGFVPADMWLQHNLEWTLGEVRKQEMEMLGVTEHEYKYGREKNDEA